MENKAAYAYIYINTLSYYPYSLDDKTYLISYKTGVNCMSLLLSGYIQVLMW